MRVEKVRIYRYDIPLRGEFRISFSSTVTSSGLMVELVGENGESGWGEANPAARILGTTLGTSREALRHLAGLILGRELEPLELHRVLQTSLLGNGDAKAAIEMAFLDLWCKERGQPVYRCLGGARGEFVTDMTIGIKSILETLEDARYYVERGFRELKIKVGEDPDRDVEKIRALREALGYGVVIRVDANQGWGPKQALRAARRLERYEVQLIEQPLPHWMLREHAELRRQTEIPIALDESVHTARDALEAVSLGAADVINIKITKAGGILEGFSITRISEAAGVANMIGCMVETRLGITAAAHLVGLSENIRYIDLDSDLSLQWDPVSGGVDHLGGGRRRLPREPGLGVRVDVERLKLLETVEEGGGEAAL